MPKAPNFWGKNRRSGGPNHTNNSEKGGTRCEPQPNSNHSSNNPTGNNNNTNNNNNNNQGQRGNKRAPPSIRSRSELRRILHDKLEWNEKTSSLDLTLLVCADEVDPAEAELIVVSSGCLATTTRYVRSDIVEAQRRKEKEERTRTDQVVTQLSAPPDIDVDLPEEEKEGENCEDCTRPRSKSISIGEELFRFDPSSKTHKCKVLNQIARSVQKAWCGLLFVPAYQLAQATAFVRSLNPKPDSSHYVDGYISRLCCLEDLLWALRSARGLLNVEPPLAYSIWHSMREEDMAQLSEYSELTCTCVIATLQERAQAPPSLLAGSELWPSVVVGTKNVQTPRIPWPSSPTSSTPTTPIDELFNDDD